MGTGNWGRWQSTAFTFNGISLLSNRNNTKQMDCPALAAAYVWSVSAAMCGSHKDSYSRSGFCEAFQWRLEQPCWASVESSFLPCCSWQGNIGLQVLLVALWGLWCRERDRVNCPSPNKSWRLLSFPRPFAKSDPNVHPIPLENLPCVLTTAEYRWPMPVFSVPAQPASHFHYLGFAYSSCLGWTNPVPIAFFWTFFLHPSPTAKFGRT